ncbi:hypothetical protein BAUCODRAFT_119459 [Baudoinia panamericana UAMH 10762]|uniref:Uncharacterized protein n=1 Tax=Baudoinia panamericana (strain UAMH 10762) TaxID=717646 RepID=M2NKC7_BAUPA|nr:uncharacterized protein BAUCODRAFT_119459 [Baudoinia panamericana UAMH 10762]EMC99894.1 hypothetical protein BAUCODRAFT_119459 [Baudoinia panamericana UAMH 10762]
MDTWALSQVSGILTVYGVQELGDGSDGARLVSAEVVVNPGESYVMQKLHYDLKIWERVGLALPCYRVRRRTLNELIVLGVTAIASCLCMTPRFGGTLERGSVPSMSNPLTLAWWRKGCRTCVVIWCHSYYTTSQ